jgi:hypothetical protein
MRVRHVLGVLSSSEASISQGIRVARETRNFRHVNQPMARADSGRMVLQPWAQTSCTRNLQLTPRALYLFPTARMTHASTEGRPEN